MEETWTGGLLAVLWAALVALIRLLYKRDQKKFTILFDWRDELTKEMPREFVRQTQCDKTHQEVRDRLNYIIAEQKHQRGLLERHIEISRSSEGGP